MTIWVFGTSNMAGACNGHLNKITYDYYHEDKVIMTGQLSKLLNEPVINFAKSGVENGEIIYYCRKALDAYNLKENIEKPRCAIVEIRGWPDRCTVPVSPTHLKDPDKFREYVQLVNQYITYQLSKTKADGDSALETDNPFMHIEDFIGTKASICKLGTRNKYECLNWPFLQAVNNISMRLMNRDEVKPHKLKMGSSIWFQDRLSEDELIKRYLQMSKPKFINDFINWDMFKWDQALYNTDITYGGGPPRGSETEEIKWFNWQKELYVFKAMFDEHNIPVRFMCWGSAFLKKGTKRSRSKIQELNIFDYNIGLVDYFKRQFGEQAWKKDLEYCECGHPGPWGHQKLAEHIADLISKEY
tara:strand:+ start:10426 stop:11499 length:1074 start_codon:yes stop_codon:yes gene_type:complete